ncbi:hypothetical protein DM02DRAFT_307916 [Periconia macrospinosa]|uniref:Uncharacterized protein n=1 Tax=Periconia macrospinosa TaxID=97972 RepID=A0A2V1DYM3_9PLEO|nr:hypothetical protein DM02DRAFT_307916 [Periconia macrospinosa]
MPRESHQLPEHSQQLLRAARAGKVFKPPPPPEEDVEKDEEDEHKEVPQGFTVKKWVKVARHLEEPEPEYLAKRRKGLPSQYIAGQVAAPPSVMRETKVKKTDAEGNVVVYKALVPEGQAVEGEVQGADAVVEAAPVAAAPGTVVEGVGVVNAEGVVVAKDVMQQTPLRRRPPPPKKKRRSGPGRGKKKVMLGREHSAHAQDAGANLLVAPHLKQEGSVEPSEGGDTPMPDAGDEEEGSGEEGSDEEDREEGTHSPPPAETDSAAPVSVTPGNPPVQPAMQSPVKPQTEDTIMTDAAPTAPTAPTAPAGETPNIPSEPVIAPVVPADVKISPEPKAEPQPKAGSSPKPKRDASSSPEMPLSTISHSRQNSLNQVPTIDSLRASAEETAQGTDQESIQNTAQEVAPVPVPIDAPTETVQPTPIAPSSDLPAPKVETVSPAPTQTEVQPEDAKPLSKVEDQAPEKVESQVIQPDLLGSLESHLEKERETMATEQNS